MKNYESLELPAMDQPALNGWPSEIRAIEYQASVDNSQQPMLIYTPPKKGKKPLLVGLHTWSADYKQAGGQVAYARWCMERDWYFIHPDFRGPNSTRDACGSEKVVQDIINAVEYMKNHHDVDTDRIYLVGASGGGHAALLMAGRASHLWAGVSAWVPISDIREWWEQKDTGRNSDYARHIEKAAGGRPDQSSEAAHECVKRSPITYLDKASGVNMTINAGVTDGHSGGSVPFTHALYAFNRVVSTEDRIDKEFIETFYEKQKLPEGMSAADPDPLYGKNRVVFRKVSKNTRVTIFQGGHEIIHNAALNWLANQRRGQPAKWTITDQHDLKTDHMENDMIETGAVVMAKQIRCRVVKVDEKATQCQRFGNAFLVDESLEGKLCARARELVQVAAEQMRVGGELASGERDLSCPDGHVVYRLTFATEATETQRCFQ